MDLISVSSGSSNPWADLRSDSSYGFNPWADHQTVSSNSSGQTTVYGNSSQASVEDVSLTSYSESQHSLDSVVHSPFDPSLWAMRLGMDGNYYTLQQFVTHYGSQDVGYWHWIGAGANHDPYFTWTGNDPTQPSDRTIWFGVDEHRKALDGRFYTYDEFIKHYGRFTGNRHWYAAGRYWLWRSEIPAEDDLIDVDSEQSAPMPQFQATGLGREDLCNTKRVEWAFLRNCKVCNRDLTTVRAKYLVSCRRCKIQVCGYRPDTPENRQCIFLLEGTTSFLCKPCYDWSEDSQ